MDNTIGSQGCTRERLNHSKISIESRTVTNGGIVVGLGMRDTEHCLLDFLKNNNLLGNAEDAQVRYDTGYKLRRIYYTAKTSGTSCIKEFGGSISNHVTDTDSDADVAEQAFHAVMKALPSKYRQDAQTICLTGSANIKTMAGAIDTLDAVYGAFGRVKNYD